MTFPKTVHSLRLPGRRQSLAVTTLVVTGMCFDRARRQETLLHRSRRRFYLETITFTNDQPRWRAARPISRSAARRWLAKEDLGHVSDFILSAH